MARHDEQIGTAAGEKVIDLDTIRRAVAEYAATKAKATSAPWRVNEHYPADGKWPSRYIEGPEKCVAETNGHPGNVEFIAAARNTPIEEWVVQLLDEVERLQRDLDAAHEIMAGGPMPAAMRGIIEAASTAALRQLQEENERLRQRDRWAALLDDIRGDVNDETLRERLVAIQSYLRHGYAELPKLFRWSE